MSYASALRGKSPTETLEDAAAAISSKPKKDKSERKSKKEKRSGIAPIDADEQDDETVRALRDKMAALHSQIAALEQKRTTTTATTNDAVVGAAPTVSGDLLSSTPQPSSDTLAGGSSILTHVGLDGGSDGRFLAPSSGHLLGAGSDQTLAVHSDEDDDGYNELVSASARYMTNSAADTPLNQQDQRRSTSPIQPRANNVTVGSTTATTTSMNPAAPSFTPNVAAAAFVPGSSSSAPPSHNNHHHNHNNAPRHVSNNFRGTANPPTSTSRPSGHASGGTTVTTMSIDPNGDDMEPLKSMSYNKNHHHDVVRDLMMLMKQQLALSKVRLGSSHANDGVADEVRAAERRLESGMSTRPGFAQFSKSSAELQEQPNTVQDEQRANAAAMVRSVLGEGAGSESSLSVSHTPDGKVHLTERLRSLADNPEEAARLLASLTEMEATEIAKEVFSPPTTKDYVVVEYKRERTKKFPCDIPVSPGDYVIVDGDRGTDCGLVVQVAKARPNHTYEVECMSSMVKNNVRKKMERGRVIRQATTDEIFSLHNEIAEVEKDALHLCRNKCIEHNIEVDLVDCEVQFDRKKVSFFFNSPIAVDFRALVRDLYNTFHIRIWMENVSPRVRNIEPFQVGGGGGGASSHNHHNDGASGSNNNRDSFSVGSNPGYRGRGGRGGHSDHPARSFTGRGGGHHHNSHHQASGYQQGSGGYGQSQGGFGQGAPMYAGGNRRGGGGAPRYQQPSHNGWGSGDAAGAGGFQLSNY